MATTTLGPGTASYVLRTATSNADRRAGHQQQVRVPRRRGEKEAEPVQLIVRGGQQPDLLAVAGGQRFTVLHRLTAELATELYSSCGLGLHHVELLKGQPAATVGNLLHASGYRCGRPVGDPRSCAAGAKARHELRHGLHYWEHIRPSRGFLATSAFPVWWLRQGRSASRANGSPHPLMPDCSW